jgi:hypothetical protein
LYSSPLAALPAGVTTASLNGVNTNYTGSALQFAGVMTVDQKTQLIALATTPTDPTDPNYAAYLLAIDNLFQGRISSGLAPSPDPSPKISQHVPAMLAALRIGSTDFASMVANEKLADTLDLLTLSQHSRFAALALALKISVTDLSTLEKLAGANLVQPTDPASLSAFVDKAQKVLRSTFSAAQLNYLYCEVKDPNQGIAPLDGDVILFLTGLQAALKKVTDGTSVIPIPAADLATVLQQKLAAVLDAANVTETMGLLDGSFQFSATLDALPPGVTLPAGVTYANKKLLSQGAISDIERHNLKALSNEGKYGAAVDALYQQAVRFIATTLSTFLNPTDAIRQLIDNAFVGGPVQVIRIGDGLALTFTGTLPAPVLRRSVTVTNPPGAVVGTDDGNGAITGAGISGTIDYQRGAVSVTYAAAPAAGNSVTVAYTLVADRQKYVLARLLARTNVIKHALSGNLGTDASITELLLETVLKSSSGKGNAIRDFLVMSPPYPGSAVWTSYELMFKSTLFVKGFRMTANEVMYLAANGSDFANFDFNGFPLNGVQASSTQLIALFTQWLRLYDVFTLTASVADRQGLFDVFKAAAHPSGPPPTPPALASQLANATGWDNGETLLLTGSAGFNLAVSDFRNEIKLLPLLTCWNLIQRLGVSAARLFHWAGDPPDFYTDLKNANEIKAAARARFDDTTWLTAGTIPINRLRDAERTALVAYVQNALQFTESGQLFDYFLIDAEMSPCMKTSRIVQAIDSVQLFVQRCLMNLESNVDASAIDSVQWQTWRKYYRVWEANREVFLYPENWIEPELRDNKSPFFKDLENELLQNDVNAQTVEDAFRNYLRKLDEVSRLEIVGTYRDAGADVLHVFGRTFHTPANYYYRQYANGVWTAWESVPLDIQGDDLIPIIYEGRLYLFWPIITIKAQENQNTTSTSGPPLRHCEIQLAWGQYQNGKWSPKQLSQNVLLLPTQDPAGKVPLDVPPSKLAIVESFVFKGIIGNAPSPNGPFWSGASDQYLAVRTYVEKVPGSKPVSPVMSNSKTAQIIVEVRSEDGGGIEGVSVSLRNVSGDLIATDTTGANGSHTFKDLLGGLFEFAAYSVSVSTPDTYWNVTDDSTLVVLSGGVSMATVAFTFRLRGTGEYVDLGEFRFGECKGAVQAVYLTGEQALLLPPGTHHDGMMFAENLVGLRAIPIGYLDLLSQNQTSVPVLALTPSAFRLLPPHQLAQFLLPQTPSGAVSATSGPAVGTTPTTSQGYTVKPASLDFGFCPVGIASAAEVGILETGGTGGNPTISIAGPDATDFSQSTTKLGVGAGWVVLVIFTPSASGTRTAALSVGSPGGSPQNVPLAGSGVQPSVTISPSSLSFDNQAVGMPRSLTA